MNSIYIKGLKIYAYHGVFAEERDNGQEFILDIRCFFKTDKVCINDNIDNSVNYAEVIDTARHAFTSANYNTIERAAQQVISAIFMQFPLVKKINIVVKKPEAPVNAQVEYCAVDITKER